MLAMEQKLEWFSEARFGMFVHFGLYSLLGRGEWAMNRENIEPAEYRKLADRFNPDRFDADLICSLAVKTGMRYITFTTMHHEGFRLYDSQLSDYNSVKTCGRDFTQEIIDAARKRNLKIGLYHSLNNWYDQPDAVDALEDKQKYEVFINNTFERIKELITKYNPIDMLWYDGWWPFDAQGWQAEKMNNMIREIQPKILVNGRNGLPGDFGTPEGHISAPSPWRPWEACMTLNNNWGFHGGDHDWKSARNVIDMLAKVVEGKGNLLLNIGPKGDGSIPKISVKILSEIGDWMSKYSECVYTTDVFDYDLQKRGTHIGDWSHHGPITMKGNNLYFWMKYWEGGDFVLAGLETKVKAVYCQDTEKPLKFEQTGTKLTIFDLPELPPDPIYPVIKIECFDPPSIYLCGGMRIPQVEHPHYDPCKSNIQL